MLGLLSRLRSRWRMAQRAGGRRRRPIGEVLPLEDRKLLYFSMSPTPFLATPKILFPVTGQFVPVTITGTFTELDRRLIANKAIPYASFKVIDDYRQIQPHGPVTLTPIGNNKYAFSLTLELKASRSQDIPGGRHYYVTIAAGDSDGWTGQTVAIWVPHDRSQLLKPKPTPHPHPTGPTPRARR